MTQQIGRGGTITLDATFQNGAGVLQNSSPAPVVDIIDPDDIEVVSNAAPTSNPSAGIYTYDYAVASDAKLGLWRIQWAGTINGVPVGPLGEYFEVVPAGTIIFDGTEAFATPLELGAWLGRTIAADDARAKLLLRTATARIQSEAKHRIFRRIDDVRTLQGGCRELWLPEPPVDDVTQVTVDDLAVAAGGWTFTRRGKLLRGALLNQNTEGAEYGSWQYWGGPMSQVVVKYTHGFSVVPDELKELCLNVAARRYGNPGGVSSESIVSYSVTFASAEVALTDDEKRVARRYHAGGGVGFV